MARLGMDVDAVESAARQLQQGAERAGALVSSIDGVVNQLPGTWDGPDSRAFVNDWWPQHRKALMAAAEAVRGLGQSALNNAAEQREVSGSGGGSGSGLPRLDPERSSGPTPFGYFPAVEPDHATVPGSATRVVAGWADGAVGRGIDVDGAYGNQCVDTIRDYTSHAFGGKDSYGIIAGGGNANEVFTKASGEYFDRIVDAPPQAGDIICIGGYDQNGGYGHVAVVERVDADGTVHVIQQNGLNPDGSTYRGVVGPSDMAHVQGYLRPKL